MVPGTTRTDLDDITGELTAAFGETLQFLGRGDATTEAGKTRAEDVRDEHQLLGLTDRTVLAGRLRALTGCPHEFGMGIADFMLGETALAVLRDQVLARESVVDLARRASFDAPYGPS
jgi:hypothetical protein